MVMCDTIRSEKNTLVKNEWLSRYTQNLDTFLKEIDKSGSETSPKVTTVPSEIITAINTIDYKSDGNDTWKYLVLIECALFAPYFAFNGENEKAYKKLSMTSKTREIALISISKWLGIDYKFVEKVQKTYNVTTKKLTGYYTKVLISAVAGIAAAILTVATMGGSIAAMFAASGLYGAAAVSSGLAALGGGAIAAGGFGMAGGMAVLIGGGFLLGGSSGAAIGLTLASSNPKGVLSELSKLYVVLKEVILGKLHDIKRAQEIIGSVVDKIAEYKKEVARLKLEVEKNKERIKNLEKSIKYLEKFLGLNDD